MAIIAQHRALFNKSVNLGSHQLLSYASLLIVFWILTHCHMTDQIIAVHTFVVALWKVGIRARRSAFGIVALASLFAALWVGIGNGAHKNFETPTPVHIFPIFSPPRLTTDTVWLVLVLDWS